MKKTIILLGVQSRINNLKDVLGVYVKKEADISLIADVESRIEELESVCEWIENEAELEDQIWRLKYS